jgi:hypothetical protein
MIKIPCILCEATNKATTPQTTSTQEAGETGREGGRGREGREGEGGREGERKINRNSTPYRSVFCARGRTRWAHREEAANSQKCSV